MDILVAFENSFSRDFARHHLARSNPEMTILAADSLEQALELANRSERLGAAALDLQMPDMEGLKGLRRFRRDCRHRIPVAVMDAQPKSVSVTDLVAAGGAGFLPYSLTEDAFIGALRLIMAGERYVPVDMALVSAGPAIDLTRREHDVLAGLRAGMSNSEIADLLALSEVTVKHHIKSLRGKLGARNRLHAVCRANELQIH